MDAPGAVGFSTIGALCVLWAVTHWAVPVQLEMLEEVEMLRVEASREQHANARPLAAPAPPLPAEGARAIIQIRPPRYSKPCVDCAQNHLRGFYLLSPHSRESWRTGQTFAAVAGIARGLEGGAR